MKRKLSMIIAVVMLAAVALTACQKRDTTVPDGMRRIESETIGVDLIVPEEWTDSMSTGAVGAYCSNNDSTNVTVMAWNVDASTTLDSWWELYEDEFNLVFDDFKLENTETTTLGGVAANKYTYTAKLGENEFKYVQCACLHWGMVYVLTFTTTPDKYETHAEEFSDMISNFAFR